jgi:C4-type Zn-finger protein
MDPESYDKIQTFLEKLTACRELAAPFSVELRDPSGNSYVENLSAFPTSARLPPVCFGVSSC